jgi:hypothetical protein
MLIEYLGREQQQFYEENYQSIIQIAKSLKI